VRGWLVVIGTLVLLFLFALSLFVGVSWFIDAAWPWSGVILACALFAGVAWVIHSWLRTRGQTRRFEGELRRIGVNGLISVVVLGNGTVWISDYGQPGPTRAEWSGDASDALRRLGGLPDESGPETFWRVFPDRQTTQAGLDLEHAARVETG
jgi:uncharacterized membrane protein